MDAEEMQFGNPFAALFLKLESVEKRVIRLSEKLDNVGDDPVNPNERITRKQLSKEKNISLGTIHNLMKKGELAYEKVGRKTLFRREEVEQFFNKKKGGKI
jgi:excisionase family DNA binding protein